MADRARKPGLAVVVRTEGGGWKEIGPLRTLARNAVRKAALAAGVGDAGEVSVLLTTDAAMRLLNHRFRDKDAPTNVLAFPGDPPLLGDVVLAFETCAHEAREQGKPLCDHVLHLIVHGMLHLAGHDHHAAAERRRMEFLEVEVLRDLGIPDPYKVRDAIG